MAESQSLDKKLYVIPYYVYDFFSKFETLSLSSIWLDISINAEPRTQENIDEKKAQVFKKKMEKSVNFRNLYTLSRVNFFEQSSFSTWLIFLKL